MHESLSLLFLFRHSSNPIRPFLPLSLTGEPPLSLPLSSAPAPATDAQTETEKKKPARPMGRAHSLPPPFPSFPFRSFSVSSVNAIAPPPFLSSSHSACGLAAAGRKEEEERGKREISEEFPLKRDSNFLFCLSQLKPLGGTRRGKFLLPPICKRKEVLTSQQRQLYRLQTRPPRLEFPPFLSLSLSAPAATRPALTYIYIHTQSFLPSLRLPPNI